MGLLMPTIPFYIKKWVWEMLEKDARERAVSEAQIVRRILENHYGQKRVRAKRT